MCKLVRLFHKLLLIVQITGFGSFMLIGTLFLVFSKAMCPS